MLKLVSLLLLGSVVASPAALPAGYRSSFCSAVKKAVGTKRNAPVTSYCGALLGISTVTTTTDSTRVPVTTEKLTSTTGTTTITAATRTSVVQMISTAPAVTSPSTSTYYETTSTSTVSSTTPLAGCATSPPLVLRGPRAKRDVQVVDTRSAKNPPAALIGYKNRQLTSACKCLSLAPATKVVTRTVAGTSTKTIKTTVKAKARQTTTPLTIVISFTTTITPTVSTVTTTTTQAYAVETKSFTGLFNVVRPANTSPRTSRTWMSDNYSGSGSAFWSGDIDGKESSFLFVLSSDGTLLGNGNYDGPQNGDYPFSRPASGPKPPASSDRTLVDFGSSLDDARQRVVCSFTSSDGTCPLTCTVNGWSQSYTDGGDW